MDILTLERFEELDSINDKYSRIKDAAHKSHLNKKTCFSVKMGRKRKTPWVKESLNCCIHSLHGRETVA